MSILSLPVGSPPIMHINSITHEGKVVGFGTDASGAVWYSVKQDGFEDSSLKQTTLIPGWENAQLLPFSNQDDDPSVLAKEAAELTYPNDPAKYLLRSRYKTQNDTAIAPVQLVSALGYIYVFRQSKRDTLLVDRYVLDGMNNKLNRALEVRFKRSKQKFASFDEIGGQASIGQALALAQKALVGGTGPTDTLDFCDADGSPFIEPTTELCLVNNLHQGWFSVVIVPTAEPDVHRWHIMAYNRATAKVELTTLRSSEQGLFEITDYTLFEQSDSGTSSRLIPGIIKRSLEIDAFRISHSLTATKYDLQVEQQTLTGEPQLLKTATRLLLAIPGICAERQSLQFDGESAYVEVPFRAELNPAQLTLACWAQPEGGPGAGSLLSSQQGQSGFVLGRSPEGKWQVSLGTAAGWVGCVAPLPAAVDVFAHVAATYDGALLRLYVNGVEAAQLAVSGYQPNAAGALRIGAGGSGDPAGELFDGKLAEVQIYSRALAPTELQQAIYRDGATRPGLQGYYPLRSVGDHGFGTLDQSGHNYHGALRGAVRVSEPGGAQAAALSFALASDGTLAQIGEAPSNTVLRRSQQEVLLPLSSLDDIRAYGSSAPPSQGVITGYALGTQPDEVANRVTITSPNAGDLNNKDQVKISGSRDYQGLYAIAKIDDNTFKINIPVDQGLGVWEKPQDPANAIMFDGKITAYRKTADGELTITCPQHGLQTGDPVQLTGTEAYNSTYTVTKIDSTHFAIDKSFPLAEGVNVKQRLARRRALSFDGQSAVVRLAPLEPQSEVTHELWFKTSDPSCGLLQLGRGTLGSEGCDRHLYLSGGNIYARLWNNETIGSSGLNLADGRWHHVAHVFGATIGGQRLYIDGEQVASGSQSKSDFSTADALYLGYSFDAAQRYFRGQLAEVRIWRQARSATAIRNSRFLQLSGSETDLIGYLRLGALVGGQVLDLSPSENHGTVSGGASLSGATLSRTLGDGSPVVRYGNSELFAVSQHATYEESFEFKLSAAAAVDPQNADGQGKPIFAFSHWGQKSRASETTTAIPSTQSRFTPLTDGWYRAACTFTVPEDVSLVRCFELSAVVGSWQSLELRRHRVRLLSNSLTESTYVDKLTLPRLGNAQRPLLRALRKAELKQREIDRLLIEKREIELKIADYNQLGRLQIEQAALASAINTLTATVSQNTAELARQRANPFNYWCEIAVAYNGWVFTYGSRRGFFETYAAPPQGSWEQQWAFIPVGDGTYLIQNRGHQERYCSYSFGYAYSYPIVTADTASHPERSWKVTDTGSGYQITPSGHLERCCRYVYRTDYAQVAVEPEGASVSTLWQLKRTNDQINNQIAVTESALTQSQTELTAAQRRKEYVDTILATSAAEKATWDARLLAVNQAISDIETAYNTLNNVYINGVKTLHQTAQAMPQVAKDARGLVTQGAVLGFVNPTSRLHALATCEGNVQLSYFDEEYRLRQTLYDASADRSNESFEQWLPDAQRVCLDYGRATSEAALSRPIALPAAWTVEVWFCYPLPASARSLNSLLRGQSGGHQLMIKDGRRLGLWFQDGVLGEAYYDCGFDLERLAPGWHHLAVVSKDDTARFYINGSEVGDTKSRAKQLAKAALDQDPQSPAAKDRLKAVEAAILTFSGDIAFVGGHAASGDLRGGRLAELRIWGLALSPAEIEVNSRTLLSGNEPGLLAYYPMNEAQGGLSRDASGSGNHLTLRDAEWRVCSAAIGRLPQQLQQFIGGADQVALSAQAFPSGSAITVSFWARGGAGLPSENCVLLATDAAGRRILNIHLPWTDSVVYFDCGVSADGGWDRIARSASPAEYQGSWSHWAFTKDTSRGEMKIYRNGQLWHSGTGCHRPLASPAQVSLGAGYPGAIFDLRILPVAQSQAEIQAGLLAPDFDAVVCSEYSTILVDPKSQKQSALMRRLLAYPLGGGLALLPDKRVETLELKWVGNAQFQPTLLGFIEGAPPVPSENLTAQDDYNGATSVELSKSQDVSYDWTRAQETGGGGSTSFFVGTEGQVEGGGSFLGTVIALLGAWKVGASGSMELQGSSQSQTSIGASTSTSMVDRLALRGTPEAIAKFPQLGKRFIPKNVGYALVVSALADVFVTRLSRSRKMIGYQVRPAKDIPPDINTISFLINPSYTMNGSLDGMTGSSPTSERYFRGLPEQRAQYGAMVPASYYRLLDAYGLKEQIENSDKRRAAYFASFDVSKNLDQGTLERGSDGAQSVDDPGKNQAQALSANQSAATQRKQAINKNIADAEKRAQATASFASWQRKMEDIQILAGKQNIVNTYVWDADGGLHSEAESFANTVQHTIGGSVSFGFSLGLGAYVNFSGFFGELSAQASFNLTQTMSKTLATSTGFSLNVNLDGVEYKGITNHDNKPILPGQKVSRYRFMSFYLEGATKHYNEFFSQVIDPEWLAGNSEGARALRQVKAGKPNKTWRVLHRVTYVERPALSSFGQDLRNLKPAGEPSDAQQLLARLSQLETKNSALESKLDTVLELLRRSTATGTT